MKAEKMEKANKMKNLKKVLSNEVDNIDRKVGENVKSEQNTNAKVFNKEGKLFFSKVELEGEKKKKKTKDTNPMSNLQKLKSEKKKIRELIESGE